VLVVLQDGRQLEGELHAMSGRYEVGGVVFQDWEINEFEDQGQASGEIATHGGDRTGKTRTPGLADLGVDSRRLAEARAIRDQYAEEEIDAVAED
jgi:hypothetical protein